MGNICRFGAPLIDAVSELILQEHLQRRAQEEQEGWGGDGFSPPGGGEGGLRQASSLTSSGGRQASGTEVCPLYSIRAVLQYNR